MIASEVGDKNFTQELDVIQLDLDDTDFVDFLVEWGSEHAANKESDASTDATSNAIMDHTTTEQETETKTGRGRRKNVMVTERSSSTNRQPRKRSKKSPKQHHPSIGSFEIETTETAECSALMAAAGN